MTPSRFPTPYRPGDFQRSQDRRDRVIYWILWAIVAVFLAYGTVGFLLAKLGGH
jgi:hypothetical protein